MKGNKKTCRNYTNPKEIKKKNTQEKQILEKENRKEKRVVTHQNQEIGEVGF